MSMLSGANFETEVPKEVSIPWKSQVRNLMSSTSFLNRGKIIFQTYLFLKTGFLGFRDGSM